MSARSKTKKQGLIRKVIEKFALGGLQASVDLGQATNVFLVPASEQGGYYVVARMANDVWVCDCKGFRFSAENTCKHVRWANKKRRQK